MPTEVVNTAAFFGDDEEGGTVMPPQSPFRRHAIEIRFKGSSPTGPIFDDRGRTEFLTYDAVVTAGTEKARTQAVGWRFTVDKFFVRVD